MKMRIPCRFDEQNWAYYPDKFYCCNVEREVICEDGELEFIGYHEDDKRNNDVNYISFVKCNMPKFPRGLSKCFPNLKVIYVSKSRLKTISKEDLINFRELKIISCWNNEIEILPGDLFDGSEGIEWISFFENMLRVIEPNFLENLENLKRVHFGNNPKYEKQFSAFPEDEADATLDEIKNYLNENFFDSDSQTIIDFVTKFGDPAEELEKYTTRIKSTEALLRIKILKSELFERSMKNEIEQLNASMQYLRCENQIFLSNIRLEVDSLARKIEKGLFGDLKKFMQNENIKDFKIIIGDREFLVHKFLLAARCPSLAETLSCNPDAGSLKLADISVEIFEKILKYLYTDELPREDKLNPLHLFAAAGRLQIADVMDFAIERILFQIDHLNAFEVFQLANKYGHDELIKKSFETIKKQHPKVEFHQEWARNPEKVKKVIEVLRKKEEAIRNAESEFKNLVWERKNY